MLPMSYLIICLASLSFRSAIDVGAIPPTPPSPLKSCNLACPQYIFPFCGSDGKTYGNECFMRIVACRTGKDIRKVSNGPCNKATTTVEPEKTCENHQVNANVNSN